MNGLHPSFRMLAWVFASTLILSACGGGGGGSHGGGPTAPTPTPTTVRIVPTAEPSAVATATGTPDAAAFVCPSSDTASSTSVARTTASGESLRRFPARHAARNASALASGATSLIGVNYDLRTATARKTALGTRETTLGGTLVRQFTFTHANILTHVLKVPTSKVASVEAALRTQPGVKAVGLTGQRRYAASVTAPYFPNDPYFTGFKSPTATSTGAPAPPATYETGLSESSSVPGQWDMHVTRLEDAFGYSQGSSKGTIPAALGSNAVKIAVIDTGEDATHPELKSKITYQKCFITNADGTAQSTSGYTTDPDGHGTDVSGIAAADTNNSFGFTGAGGNVALYAYRVFPTPDDNCVSDTSTDVQCGSDTGDIAAAIDDAVKQKVNVISMSLGGGQCNSDGSDADPTEGAAVEEALAAKIIVVAAAGNSSGPPTESPGCDNYGTVGSVLAVGATALSDGTTNASGDTVGSATAPQEYVASYTDYGTPGAAVNSASAWGIVAPGGDPSGDSDNDDLHWIENIWTSAPYDSNFAGSCTPDYPNQTGTTDCRVLIAGTSMATPHVAGAAALILSVNAAYQSPALMRTLLCSTADDIGDANEGCGRLDVYRAMASALGDADPGPSPVP